MVVPTVQLDWSYCSALLGWISSLLLYYIIFLFVAGFVVGLMISTMTVIVLQTFCAIDTQAHEILAQGIFVHCMDIWQRVKTLANKMSFWVAYYPFVVFSRLDSSLYTCNIWSIPSRTPSTPDGVNLPPLHRDLAPACHYQRNSTIMTAST